MECCGIRGLTSQWFQSYLKERRQLTVVQAIKFDNNSINHGSLLWYLLLIFTIQLNIAPYITLQMIQTYVSEKNHTKKIIKHINRDLLLTADWIRLKNYPLMSVFRSSHPEVFLGKGAMKICSKFTGEHSCRSAILIKLLCTFSKVILLCYFGSTTKSQNEK